MFFNLDFDTPPATSDPDFKEFKFERERHNLCLLLGDSHHVEKVISDQVKETENVELTETQKEKLDLVIDGILDISSEDERYKHFALLIGLQAVEQAAEQRPKTQPPTPWSLARLTSDGTTSPNSDYIYDPNACGQGVDVYIAGSVRGGSYMCGQEEFRNLQQDGTRVDLGGRPARVDKAIAAGNKCGVAKRAVIIPVHLEGIEEFSRDVDEILARKTPDRPAVVNISDSLWPLFAAELVRLIKGGVHVVVAAGNDNRLLPEWNKIRVVPLRDMPYLKTVICVGASSQINQRCFKTREHASNYGPMVDLFAPGDNIMSATHGSDSSYADAGWGTSWAAPYVAGIIACLLSHNDYKKLTPKEMKDKILAMAWQQGVVGELVTSAMKASNQDFWRDEMVERPDIGAESMKAGIRGLNKNILVLDEAKEENLEKMRKEVLSDVKNKLGSDMDRLIAKNKEDRVHLYLQKFMDRQVYLKRELGRIRTYIQDVAKEDLLAEIADMIQQLGGDVTKSDMEGALVGMKQQRIDTMTVDNLLLDPERLKHRIMTKTKSRLVDRINTIRINFVWKLAPESVEQFNILLEEMIEKIGRRTWVLQVSDIDVLKTKLKELTLDVNITTTRRLASCRLDRWGLILSMMTITTGIYTISFGQAGYYGNLSMFDSQNGNHIACILRGADDRWRVTALSDNLVRIENMKYPGRFLSLPGNGQEHAEGCVSHEPLPWTLTPLEPGTYDILVHEGPFRGQMLVLDSNDTSMLPRHRTTLRPIQYDTDHWNFKWVE
ncbi:peptidase S8/S53 domain-containing protein [Amanita rubescens]|nr:peptidase S8/S53 domain-containing protein [Amanita rubescens]